MSDSRHRDGCYHRAMDGFERSLLRLAILQSDGSLAKAAFALGLTYSGLSRRMDRLGMPRPVPARLRIQTLLKPDEQDSRTWRIRERDMR